MLTRTFVRSSWRSCLTGLGLLAAVSIVAVSMLQGQSTSSLHGVVSDAQDAVIPGAVVSLSSATTGLSGKRLQTTLGNINSCR